MHTLIPPDQCPCPKSTCIRHGKCEECRNYHYSLFKLPFCERQDDVKRKLMQQQRKEHKLQIKQQKKQIKKQKHNKN
ncbi:hypothetical protein [Candidatus Lokiarchaeum ossiferum]|uniref:hypothetical protein n=1 Tax=Candidatus Lokiarchaeum ossiferum TaxID=2951803 RepID=UPI00352E1F62